MGRVSTGEEEEGYIERIGDFGEAREELRDGGLGRDVDAGGSSPLEVDSL